MLVQPTRKNDDGWWYGMDVLDNSKKGFFPANYCESLEYDDPRLEGMYA